MQLIENEVLSNQTFAIDEKQLVNCRYENCNILYSGGDYGWTNTTFENCRINLTGPALRTAALLQNFGLVPSHPAVPATGKVKAGAIQ